nr:hypothetical protein [Desulfobacula sp.]
MATVDTIKTYRTNDLYLRDNKSVIKPADTAKTAGSGKTASTESPAVKTDTVTLSGDVAVARMREALGLPPTGRLSREDFQTAADSGEEAVRANLDSAMEKLGVDPDQTVSLSLNTKGKLVIKETFPQKAALEKQLNSDEAFKAGFTRLSTNTEILDFAADLQTGARSMSLASFMNNESGDSDWNSLFKLAEDFNELKSGKDPLQIIAGLSHRETPFELVHPAGEDTTA